MYTTIEADLDNGKLTGPEVSKLPASGHVLITLIGTASAPRPAFGTHTSKPVRMRANALEPLTDQERSEWGL